MGDIRDVRLLYLKGLLFVVLGMTASALLVAEHLDLKSVFLLTIAIWAFARAYYFAFYVIEHYVDHTYKFAGLWSFVRYALARRSGESVTRRSQD